MSTPMKQEEKDWIDSATYEQLLHRLRFSPAGDSLFIGDSGKYFSDIMATKRSEGGPGFHTMISKKIGWDK